MRSALPPPCPRRRAQPDLPPAVATARFAWATTIAVTVIAVLGPILGAIADYRGQKKRLLGICLAVGVVATFLMATINAGQWMYAAAIFIVANAAVDNLHDGVATKKFITVLESWSTRHAVMRNCADNVSRSE